MTKEQLSEILDEHARWLRGEKGAKRADLTGTDLTGTDLTGTNLTGANLTGGHLAYANLAYANLTGAYLAYANLAYANLAYANLTGAYLTRANLAGAYLTRANLAGANLTRAYLEGAILTGAIHDQNTTWPVFLIVPDEGAFIGWKKLRSGVIAKLEIPSDAKRVGGLTGRKCRAEFVKTLALYGGTGAMTAASRCDGKTTYTVGEITRPDRYDPDFTTECSHGIHFLVTRREAEEYVA